VLRRLLAPVFVLACAASMGGAPSQASSLQSSQSDSQSTSSTSRSSSSPTNSHTVKKIPAKSSGKKIAPGTKKTSARKKHSSPRFRRLHQAFVASASLKPMGRQLLQDRTPAAYSGVQAYAVRHTREDAGALAWLVIGYARALDHQYAQAIDPLNRAKPHAGDLGDYVSYYLAESYFQTNRLAEAIATLSGFESRYPESLLIRDAHVLQANVLMSEGRSAEVIALLEPDRVPQRADLELLLGRAYEAAGQPAKAAPILQNLYFNLPLAGESAQAQSELQKIGAVAAVAPATFAEKKSRADLLFKGRRYQDAAAEYQSIMPEAGANDRPQLDLALATSLRHAGETHEAKKILEAIPATTPEINAERLFNLGELQRASNDDSAFLQTLGEIRQQNPQSPWLEQALLSAGNIFLLRKDYDRAIDSYRELQHRFPNGGRATYAHWKVAWLNLRQGRTLEAKQGFEEQLTLYPLSPEVPAAIYWRGRLAEEDGDLAMAGAFYQKVSERYRNYYYGALARSRLATIKNDGVQVHYALLDHIPAIDSGTRAADDTVPTDNLRVQKAHLLENGGLLDFAVRELRGAAEKEKGNWLAPEVARVYEDGGRYDLAIESLKKAAPNYFAVDLPTLPRSYWEALFPKAYWPDLTKFSSSNSLDPYLVASLIRQESEFNPNAVSNRDAVGLMQLLPKVGKSVAKQEKLKHFSATQLLTPAVNLELGTKYFRSMVDKFGSFEYALAAYNAGSDRVQDWLGAGKYRDPQEFVESIPFTETREYVEAIMRNANVYRQLYGTP
jgi:soluble lytic murein transglycosylase